MLLPYDDFRSFYDELGMGEEEGHDHFEALVNTLECIVRHFWDQKSGSDVLGISVENSPVHAARVIESKVPLPGTFNENSADKAGRDGP